MVTLEDVLSKMEELNEKSKSSPIMKSVISHSFTTHLTAFMLNLVGEGRIIPQNFFNATRELFSRDVPDSIQAAAVGPIKKRAKGFVNAYSALKEYNGSKNDKLITLTLYRVERYFSNVQTYRLNEDISVFCERVTDLHSREISAQARGLPDIETRFDYFPVFETLMDNVIQHGKSKKVISVEIGVHKEEDDYLVLYFQDSGYKIRSNVRRQIFEQGVSTKPHGGGVGLYAARELMEQRGGSIRLDENENKFYVKLLLEKAGEA